ncbi:MAG: hypothetical protein QXJ64_10090 [Thermosphaera sp.]
MTVVAGTGLRPLNVSGFKQMMPVANKPPMSQYVRTSQGVLWGWLTAQRQDCIRLPGGLSASHVVSLCKDFMVMTNLSFTFEIIFLNCLRAFVNSKY